MSPSNTAHFAVIDAKLRNTIGVSDIYFGEAFLPNLRRGFNYTISLNITNRLHQFSDLTTTVVRKWDLREAKLSIAGPATTQRSKHVYLRATLDTRCALYAGKYLFSWSF